jgi:uncharacterized protein
MTEVGRRLALQVREGLSAVGRAAMFLLASGLSTIILASPLVMLRSGFLAPGVGPEDMEIGRICGAAGALAATALAIALFEQGRLVDIGIRWRAADRHNLMLGLAGGVGGALLVTMVPLIVGAAVWNPVPSSRADLHNFVYYVIVLVIGSFGEELEMRGYPFQVMLRWMGLLPTLVLTSALFAVLHAGNPGADAFSVVNTFLFGAALGYAMWRSGGLWLPIGLHVGWNLTLPVFGANLSGFAYRLTVYEMNWKVPDLWSGGNYGPEGGLLASLALVAWFVWIYKAPVVYQHNVVIHPPGGSGRPPGSSPGSDEEDRQQRAATVSAS